MIAWKHFWTILLFTAPVYADFPNSAVPITTAASMMSAAELSAGALLHEAQLAYNQRASSEKVKEAIAIWEQVLKMDASNYEALWKLSRAYYWVGNHSPEKEKLDLFTKGKNLAEAAVKTNPEGVDGHYWLGINLGRYGESKGILKSLSSIKPIRNEMEKILKLDSKHAGAHHVLGVLYRKAPGKPISMGNKKKALVHAKKAVELDSTSLRYAIGLAEAESALGHKEEAKKVLEEVLRMPPNSDFIPESLEDKEEAQKLLKELDPK